MGKRELCLACLMMLGSGLAWSETDDLSEQFYSSVRGNDLVRLKTIVDKGADVNTVDGRGETPLMYAAVVGSVEAMRFLLEHHADPNAQNQFGSTALIWSARPRRREPLHNSRPSCQATRGPRLR